MCIQTSRNIADMLVFLLFVTLTASVLAEFEPQSTYKESGPVGRVVGGDLVTSLSYWPWLASLQYYSGGSYHHFCGGILIASEWVMTAAHCVYSPRSVRVVLGDLVLYNNDHWEQYKHVANVYIHPDWNNHSISSGNDIALLRLTSKASFNSYVKAAYLPPSGMILLHNQYCYITGYGATSTGGGMSNRRRQAYVPVVDHETCTSSGWWGSTVKTTMICAGGGAKSACNGDFGGPLTCYVDGNYYVHGIASFVSGMGCNAPQKPTVFTRVSAYIVWINSVMRNP